MASDKGFQSLGDQLREAVRDKFGDYWLDEFTDDQAILSKSSVKSQPCSPSSKSPKQFSVSYAVDGDNVSFSGKPIPVERVTRFEPVPGRGIPTDLLKHLGQQDGVVGKMASKALQHREKKEGKK